LSWVFYVATVSGPVSSEELLLRPAMMKSSAQLINIVPTMVVRHVKIRNIDCQIAVKYPVNYTSVYDALKLRFHFAKLGLVLMDSSDNQLPQEFPFDIGATRAGPICIRPTLEVTQQIEFIGVPGNEGVQNLSFPLDARVPALRSRLGPGKYTFTHKNLPVYQNETDYLSDYPITDPIQVTKIRGQVAPKALTQSTSGRLVDWDVVFPDDSIETVRISDTKTINDVIEQLREIVRVSDTKSSFRTLLLNGQQPIVKLGDDGGRAVLLDATLKNVTGPRTLWLSFPESDTSELLDGCIRLAFYGQMCSIPVNARDTVAVVRRKLKLLLRPDDGPIIFRRGETEIGDSEFLSSQVTATITGPLHDINYDELGEKPRDYAQKLELIEAISKRKHRECCRFFNFHNFDAQLALLDLLMPS
jgi:hypothetical protein